MTILYLTMACRSPVEIRPGLSVGLAAPDISTVVWAGSRRWDELAAPCPSLSRTELGDAKYAVHVLSIGLAPAPPVIVQCRYRGNGEDEILAVYQGSLEDPVLQARDLAERIEAVRPELERYGLTFEFRVGSTLDARGGSTIAGVWEQRSTDSGLHGNFHYRRDGRWTVVLVDAGEPTLSVDDVILK